MMYHEFAEIVEKVNGKPLEISTEDYNLVEYVYTWHPLDFEKVAVAKLYIDFGIEIFKDLKPRANIYEEEACLIGELRSHNRYLKLELSRLNSVICKLQKEAAER